MHSASKGTVCPGYSWTVKYPLSATFNLLHSSTNQELFESFSVIKVATNWPFLLSAKMNGTLTRTLVRKSTKNALYILYAKRHLSGWNDIKQQACSLNHYCFTLAWRSKSVSQSEIPYFLILQFFEIILGQFKACLVLVLPAPLSLKLVFGWYCFIDHTYSCVVSSMNH